jgi:DNA-binding MarR family transcriptional regulator
VRAQASASARLKITAHEVAASLRAAISPLMRELQTQRLDTQLTQSQISVLSLLDKGGAATPSSLAAQEQIRPQSIATILAQLYRRRLITRAPDGSDARRVVVSITSRGTETLNNERDERVRYLESVLLEEFDQEEIEQLARAIPLLDRLRRRP